MKEVPVNECISLPIPLPLRQVRQQQMSTAACVPDT